MLIDEKEEATKRIGQSERDCVMSVSELPRMSRSLLCASDAANPSLRLCVKARTGQCGDFFERNSIVDLTLARNSRTSQHPVSKVLFS